MRIKAAWLLLSLSSALCSPPGIAIAQDGTVVPKSPPTTGTVAPQDEQSYDAAEPAPGELNQGNADEGAGWDAAVEAAPAATPLIGEQQDAAVQAHQRLFQQPEQHPRQFRAGRIPTTSARPAASTCSVPASYASTTRRRARSASLPTGIFSPSRTQA